MSFLEKIVNMKIPDEKMHFNPKNSYRNHLSQISNEEKCRQELFALCPKPSFEAQPSPSGLSQLYSTGNLSGPVKIHGAKPRKRKVQSEAGPKSRKKNKIKNSLNIFEEDKCLDNDLLGLAGSIDASNKMDSDSSADTIILDDSSNSPDKMQKVVQSDVYCGKYQNLNKDNPFNELFVFKKSDPLPISNTPDKLLNAKMQGNVSINSVNATNRPDYYFQTDSTLARQSLSSVNLLYKNNQHIMANSKQHKHISNTSGTLLKEALIALQSPKVPKSFSALSSTSNTFLNSTSSRNYDGRNKNASNNAKQQKKNCNRLTSATSIASLTPNSSNLNQKSNFKSIYESMGLDEDLCDVDNKKSALNLTSKVPCESTYSSKVDKLLNVPIKIERDDDLFLNKVSEKNLTRITNEKNECVSMTFEAESPNEDNEDVDDDLPLSFLKNRSSGGKMEPKLEEKHNEVHSTVGDSTIDIHPSLFIKKELIEDEIVSESQAVSAKHLEESVLKANSNNLSFVSSEHDIAGTKIKSEPIDSEYSFSQTASLINSNADFGHPPNRNGEQATILDSFINKDGIQLNAKSHSSKRKKSDASSPASEVSTENSICKSNPVLVNFLNSASKNDLDIQSLNKNSNFQTELEMGKPSVKVTNATKTKGKISKTVTKRKKTPTKKGSRSAKKNSSSNSELDSISSELAEKTDVNVETSKTESTEVSDVLDTEAENLANTKKGGKKKKITKKGKASKIDENVPLTLLISKKKKNSDETDAPDSFLCTNISGRSSSVNSASNSVVDSYSTENISEEVNENSGLIESHIDSYIESSENFLANKTRKKKKTRRKKPRKKKVQKNNNVVNTANEVQSEKELESLPVDRIPLIPDDTTEKAMSSTKQGNRAVLTAFEGDFSRNEVVMNVDSEAKTIKRGKKLPMQLEEFSDTSYWDDSETQDSQIDESMSTISSLTSNSNMGDINSKSRTDFDGTQELIPKNNSKKKKKRGTVRHWYKKKKSRTIGKTSPFIEAPQVYESVPKIKSNDHVETMNRVPIVVIKNLLPELKAKQNTDELSMDSSLCSEQEPVSLSPSKGKKRKGKKARTGNKRKMKSVKLSDSSPNNDLESLKDSVAECDIGTGNNNLENELCNASNQNNSEIHQTKEIAEIAVHESANKEISPLQVEQSVREEKTPNSQVLSGQSRRTTSNLFPSLDVDEIAQEIAKYEALFSNHGEGTNSTKNIQVSDQNVNNSNLGSETVREHEDQTQIISKDLPQNSIDSLLCKSNALKPTSAKFGDESLDTETNVLPISGIQIKKGVYSSSTMPINSSFQLAEKDTVDNMQVSSSFLRNSISIKKEKITEGDILQKSFPVKCTEKSTANLNAENHSADKVTLNSVAKINSPPQSSQSVDINGLALRIKREVCDVTKSQLPANCVLKDQNELIQKMHGSQLKDLPTNKPAFINSKSSDNLSESDLKDDEILVLPPEEKLVTCVDLTDDICSGSVKEALEKVSHFDTSRNLTSPLIDQKSQDLNPINNSATDTQGEVNEKFLLPLSKKIESQSDLFNENILTPDFVSKELIETDGQDEKSNAFTEKYKNDYFDHPFPPSVVLYNKKQRNRNAMYTRINSNSWNLTVEEVGNRLRISESTVPQFGKKLGDIIKLKKYPVSLSEIECYHRILGVAPSHKLLSKCYASPGKKYGTFLKLKSPIYTHQENVKELKTDEDKKQMLSLDDIIQGIAETKMMYSNPVKNNLTLYDRDCPSTDTRDSFDSHVSSLSDKSYAVNQMKDTRNLINLLPAKENEIIPPSNDASSSGRNSVLSCAASDFQDSLKNDMTNVDFSTIKNSDLQFVSSLNFSEIKKLSSAENNLLTALPNTQFAEQMTDRNIIRNLPCTQINTLVSFALPSTQLVKHVADDNEATNVSCLESNSLTNLTLPSRELVEHVVDNTEVSQSSYAETTHTSYKSLTELPPNQYEECEPVVNKAQTYVETPHASSSSFSKTVIEADSNKVPSNMCAQFEPTINSNEDSRTSFDIKNNTSVELSFPVSELREILKTAGNLGSDASNSDETAVWKSKATFEYNHTQSTPLVGININKSTENIESTSSLPHASPELDDSGRKSLDENSKLLDENSDDDYVENEPLYHEFNDEDDENDDKMEITPHSNEKVSEEPIKIKEYKSKWEKIMERKSQEVKEKPIINKHLLDDHFAVSSTIKTPGKRSLGDVSKACTNESNSSKKEDMKEQNKSNKFPTKKSLKQNKSMQKCNDNFNGQNSKSTNNSNRKEKVNDKIEQNATKKALRSKWSNAEETTNLFAPDKLIKTSNPKKTDLANKANDNGKAKRFYGNRVTNRGTFLTETKPPEVIKRKIPKKKMTEISKKPVGNVRSEEFHSMVNLPDINIEPTINSKYKKSVKSVDSRKNSEFYKSPLSDTVPSTTSHFIRTKRMRDRQYGLMNSQFSGKSNMQNRRNLHVVIPSQSYKSCDETHRDRVLRTVPLLETPPPMPSPDHENMLSRNVHLLDTPSGTENSLSRKVPLLSAPSGTENFLNRKVPLLRTPSTVPTLYPVESTLSVQNPVLSNLPSVSSELPTNSFQSAVDPSMTSMLQKIMSVFQNNNSAPLPERQDTGKLPFSETATWNNIPFNSSGRAHDSTSRPINVHSNASTSALFGNVSSADPLDPRKAARLNSIPSAPINNQFDPCFDSNSPALNSPPFTATTNVDDSAAPQSSRKATCLVPQHLKSLVGHEIFQTNDVQLLMLEWSVGWLVQQQRNHDPPPISNALKKVVSTYDSFEDYYNTYFPLMLLDTWHRIYVSWTHLNQTSPYSCQITSYSVKSQFVSVECQAVFNTDAHPKGVFPDEGSILMVKYSSKSNEYTIKILGYVTNVKTRRFNSVTDSKIFSCLEVQKVAKPEALQILTLTFMGAYNSEDIDKRQPVRIHVLCNVKSTLKQNDALLYINNSPLIRSILNPVADGLRSLTLTPRNSSEEKTNECVRNITKGILSPHPLPLLTIVTAKPESDRLNIIPLLIAKMKSSYRTKVLLCVRTPKTLSDIAVNIGLNQSLKLVIVNKRCDTSPQNQKYLLDELVMAEVKKLEEKSGDKVHVKNETLMKVKKQILSNCDVILSLIRNSHDELMYDTFKESDSIAQMCCIVDEANLCTEPETLIPILHGISKLILIGDPEYPAKVCSKTASSYDYNQSFFQRAYDLDLLEE